MNNLLSNKLQKHSHVSSECHHVTKRKDKPITRRVWRVTF